MATTSQQYEERLALAASHASSTAEAADFSILRRTGPWRDALRRRMLATADVAGVTVALAVVSLAGAEGSGTFPWALAVLPVWLVLAKLHGLYDHDHRALRHLTTDELSRLVAWATTGTAAVVLILSATPPGAPPAAYAVEVWLGTVIAVPVLRAAARALWRRITPPERVLIVGSGPIEQATRRKLALFSDMHLQLAGTVDEHALNGLDAEPGGDTAEAVRAVAGDEHIERMILATQQVDERLIAGLVAFCRRRGIKLSIIPPARGTFGTAVQLDHVADLPLIAYNTWDVARSSILLKRTIDLVIAFAALVVLSPLLLVIVVLVRLDSRGGSLFTQRRAGLDGQPFTMLKFRTMTADAPHRLSEVVSLDELPEPAFKLRDDPRVTRCGRVLRRWSLDELPQLLNVIRGDMSLVGPRPEQVEVAALYTEPQRVRLSAKPGITGPMQVFGRGQLSFDERLAVERDYIENPSLGRDLRLLAMTVATVLRGRGAF